MHRRSPSLQPPKWDGLKPQTASCHLVLTSKNVLDTSFINKHTRQPLYTTITRAGVTTLHRFGQAGDVLEVAQVQWDTTAKDEHMVVADGRRMRYEELLSRTKSLFGSQSRAFDAGGCRCKWKHREDYGSTLDILWSGLRAWQCFSSSASTRSESPLPSHTNGTPPPSSPTLLAVFLPPQHGSLKAELMVFEAGIPMLNEIVFTAVLMATTKSQWREARSQSSLTVEDLVEMGHQRLGSTVRSPPYRRALSPGHQQMNVQHWPPGLATIEDTSSMSPPPYKSTVSLRAGV
ncbi:hypothetical protein EWM64_g6314 [Hericium alpestre]|uniref:Uncharacterized protein n=1 Tax=Hericium alpestre TaxID=135208 RepID=A0A4Y9ZSD6_9AGAM|nr:hypothetical protein EWM64_g6314 [Hericium alpestre]